MHGSFKTISQPSNCLKVIIKEQFKVEKLQKDKGKQNTDSAKQYLGLNKF
jgi:hypothetical protein